MNSFTFFHGYNKNIELNFDNLIFPIPRSMFHVQINDIVSIGSLTIPNGLLFYMDYQYNDWMDETIINNFKFFSKNEF